MQRFLPIAAAVSAGCATMGTFQRAETLAPGRTEWVVEANAWGGVNDPEVPVMPALACTMRRGIGERSEVGLRFGTTPLEAYGKFEISRKGGVVVSVAPSLGGYWFGGENFSAGEVFVQAPLVVGVPIGKSELVLAPKLHDLTAFGYEGHRSGGVVTMLSVGGSVGAIRQVTPGFALYPEVTILHPLFPSERGWPYYLALPDRDDTLLYNLGIGVMMRRVHRGEVDYR